MNNIPDKAAELLALVIVYAILKSLYKIMNW